MSALEAALVAAQKDMPAVKPNAVNPHFRSQFVTLDHLIAETRPVLNRHGLSISQWPAFLEGGAPALVTRLSHESGEAYEQTMPLLVAGNDMQKLGAALTYARRYAWAAALGISADDDDDGNQASAPAMPSPGVDRAAPAAAGAAPERAARADANVPPDEFVLPFGKHKGKTLNEVPREYLEWFSREGKDGDVKDVVNVFLNLTDEVPF